MSIATRLDHARPGTAASNHPDPSSAQHIPRFPSSSPALSNTPTPSDHDQDLVVVPRRQPLLWVAVALVALALALFVEQLVTNPVWDWPTFAAYFASRSVMLALVETLKLTLLGVVFGFGLGIALAAMRLSEQRFLNAVAFGFVWVFRSIPLMVQLIFWFNIGYIYGAIKVGVPFGPTFFTIPTNSLLSAMGAAVVGLALHQAAYAAEIIRAGILSVDAGQFDAAEALGIPRARRLFHIVLPQAMPSILPNAANEVVGLFKGTSIVSVLAIPELFYQVQVIYGRNSRVIPLLMVATVWYIILTTLLSVAQHAIEKHYARGRTRGGRAKNSSNPSSPEGTVGERQTADRVVRSRVGRTMSATQFRLALQEAMR